MKTILKTSVIIVVCLAIGFFAGMEYKAYQIRTAFDDAAKEITNLFGGSASATVGEETISKTEDESGLKEGRRDEETDSAKRLRQMVDMEVVNKGFTPSDFMNGRYEDTIDFSFKFINSTEKEVRGVQGTVIFYDIFENEIYRSNISYDGGIPANDSFVWKAGIDFNEFIDEQVRLKNTELENLQYKWIPDTVIFADGSKEQ